MFWARLVVVGIVCLHGQAWADSPPTEKVVFENGFTAILLENHGAPMIGSSIIVGAGSIHEKASNNGVSHMLEHLLFNGTTRRTQEALYAEQAQFGIYNNAHTSQAYTNYIVLAESDHFETAIDIQSDMLFQSVLPPDKFEKEKGIVLNEIAKDWASPSYWATEQFNRTFFKGTPYNLTVLGTPERIRNMTRAQVREYYQTYYVPNNMTAVIVGDFERSAMIALLRKYFGTQPPRPLPTETTYTLDESVFGTQVRSELAVPSPYVAVGIEAPSITHPDYYPISIFTQLTQRNLKSLLNAELGRKDQQPVVSVGLDYQANTDFGVIRVTAVLQEGNDPSAVLTALNTILPHTVSAKGNQSVIANLGTELKVQDLALLEKPHYYGMMKADAIAEGGWVFAQSYSDRIASVTTRAVTEAASRVFTAPKQFASIIVPGPSTLTERIPDLSRDYYGGQSNTAAMSGASIERAATWQLRQLGSAIMDETSAFTWAPSRTGNTSVQAPTRVQLNNGLTIHIDSNSDSKMFAIHLLAKHRAWSEPHGKEGIADLLHSLLGTGTATLNREAFEEELSRIGATLKTRDSDAIPFDDYYHSRLYSYLRFTTIDNFAEHGIQLFSDLVQHPRFLPSEVALVQRQALARINERDSNPSKRAESILYQALFPQDPRGRPIEGTQESVASITVNDLKTFHTHYFSPHNLIISVSTSLPLATITKWLNDTLGHLPRQEASSQQITSVPSTIKDSEIRATLGASQSYIRLGSVFPVTPADQPALAVLNNLFSTQLSFDLRERQGLSYHVQSGIYFMGDQALLSISMGTTPGTREKAFAALMEAVGRITQVPIEQHVIERIVNARNARYLMRRLTRINQAYRTGLAALHREHPGWAPPSPSALKRVTAHEAQAAMKTYFQNPQFVTVIVE